jgi:hypothetical protein
MEDPRQGETRWMESTAIWQLRETSTGKPAQGNQHRETSTGKPAQGNEHREASTGKPAQGNQHRETSTGKRAQGNEHREASTGKPAQGNQHRGGRAKHKVRKYDTLQRQFRLYIPFLGIARPQPQFPHSCVCGRFIYSQDRSTYFLQQKRQTHRGNIFVSHFRHFVFAL